MDNYAYAADLVRRRDRDRYLADLYAPEASRRHLFALHAFAVEVARVREMVSDPMLGEVRLRWWRDALQSGNAAGHPVAAALLETAGRFNLPSGALDGYVAASVFDLYDDPMATLDDLEGHAGETSSALLQLAAIVVAGGSDPASADVSGHGGVGETLVWLLLHLGSDPRRVAKYVPDQLLDAHGVKRPDLEMRNEAKDVLALLTGLRILARQHPEAAAAAAARLPAALAPAYLPLAVARARLDQLQRYAAHPFAPRDLPAWRRQWIMWRAARDSVRPAAVEPVQPRS